MNHNNLKKDEQTTDDKDDKFEDKEIKQEDEKDDSNKDTLENYAEQV